MVIGGRPAVVRDDIFGSFGALHDRRTLDRASGNGAIECWTGSKGIAADSDTTTPHQAPRS